MIITKPIKTRFNDAVKVEWRLSKKSMQILSLYSKYTKYDEEFILEKLIEDILSDAQFREWISKRRSSKRISEIMTEIDEDANIIG